MIETSETKRSPSIQIVLSTDVSPLLDRRSHAQSALVIRVQHLEATQPDHLSDLDPHGSERSQQTSQQERATATMPQSPQPLALSTSSPPLSSKPRRLQTTREPIFYFYESSGSDLDGSDYNEEEHDYVASSFDNNHVAVLTRKRRRGNTQGSHRRLAYTTPRKHATRLTSKGTLRSVHPASGAGAGRITEKRSGALTNDPRTSRSPSISPTSPAAPKGSSKTSGRNVDSPCYSPTVQREQLSTISFPLGTPPARHGRTGSTASSGSASRTPVAVHRSNMEGVIMPKPAGRQSSSISSFTPPILPKNAPSPTTTSPASITRRSNELVVSTPPVSPKRPGHALHPSVGSARSLSPPSPVVETTVKLSVGGSGPDAKPLDDFQSVAGSSKASQPVDEGPPAPAPPSTSPVGGRLGALFKRKSKPALMQQQQHVEPSSVERPTLPELVRCAFQDLPTAKVLLLQWALSLIHFDSRSYHTISRLLLLSRRPSQTQTHISRLLQRAADHSLVAS